MTHNATPFSHVLDEALRVTKKSLADVSTETGLAVSRISRLRHGRDSPPEDPEVVARLASSIGVEPSRLQQLAAVEHVPSLLRMHVADSLADTTRWLGEAEEWGTLAPGLAASLGGARTALNRLVDLFLTPDQKESVEAWTLSPGLPESTSEALLEVLAQHTRLPKRALELAIQSLQAVTPSNQGSE